MEERGKEILIRMPNWIGDCIMSIPALRALSRKYRLTLIGKPWLAELFKGQSFFHRIVPFKSIFQKLPRAETGILFTNSFSSALNFFINRINKRIGFSTDLRRVLLTDPIPLRKDIHQVLQYNLLAEHLTDEVDEKMELDIENSKKEIDVIILPSASSQAKRWGEEKYRILGEWLKKKGFTVLYVGAESEKELLQRAAGSLPFAIPLMVELPRTLSRARVVVGNDTGPIHIAVAVGTKVIAIFGPTDPILTAPWGQNDAYIYKNPSCGPCHRKKCPPSKHLCMNSITVEEVFEKTLNLLKGKP